MSIKYFLTIAIAALTFAHGVCANLLNGPLETRIGRIDLQAGYPSAGSVKKLYDEMDFHRDIRGRSRTDI